MVAVVRVRCLYKRPEYSRREDIGTDLNTSIFSRPDIVFCPLCLEPHVFIFLEFSFISWPEESKVGIFSLMTKTGRGSFSFSRLSSSGPGIAADSRKLFCFLGCLILGFTATQVARFIEISLHAVSFAIRGGERIVKKKYQYLSI